MSLIGHGFLGPGQAEYFDVLLTAGINYKVYARPADLTVDFDLFIYDENGTEVSKDDTLASDALCGITPRWTGPFRLMVKAARGASLYSVVVTT